MIIGVVAALTIPNLMQKYTEQTTVKKVQKFYSNLSNAYSLAMKENGPKNEWGIKGNYDAESTEKIYEILFKPYFKIAKDCGIDNTGNCVANISYRGINNLRIMNWHYSRISYKLVLDDGSAIILYTLGTVDNPSVVMATDTNGAKGPNQYGRDTFFFFIFSNGKFGPSGSPATASINYLNNNFHSNCNPNGDSSDTNSGTTCAAWVIYKGNMDYLHCDDLSWTGKDKCK